MDKLIALGVNKIIALGHSGFEVDQKIAKTVRGVDVVIGGHTNTFLYTGMYQIIAYGVMFIISVAALDDDLIKCISISIVFFLSWSTVLFSKISSLLLIRTDEKRQEYSKKVIHLTYILHPTFRNQRFSEDLT